MALTPADLKRQLDHASPAANHAALGTTLTDIITAFNDLRAQYVALLAKLDTAAVAGGTNAAACSPAQPALAPLGSRSPVP